MDLGHLDAGAFLRDHIDCGDSKTGPERMFELQDFVGAAEGRLKRLERILAGKPCRAADSFREAVLADRRAAREALPWLREQIRVATERWQKEWLALRAQWGVDPHPAPPGASTLTQEQFAAQPVPEIDAEVSW